MVPTDEVGMKRDSINSVDSFNSTEGILPDSNYESPQALRSKTLKHFGIIAITAGCITSIITLASFLIYHSLWKLLLCDLVSALLLVPLGILCIMSGTNVEDPCHIMTTNILGIIVSGVEVGNIILIGLGFDMDKVIILSLLIPFSVIKVALCTAISWLCSKYSCRGCSNDDWQTPLVPGGINHI